MRWNVVLFPNGTPALLNDQWLLRLTASRPVEPRAAHEVEVGLNLSTPPAVQVDFLWMVWRIALPGCPIHIETHGAPLPAGRIGMPGEPPVTSRGFLHPEATWRTRRGAIRHGVAFQLDVMAVYRPAPRD